MTDLLTGAAGRITVINPFDGAEVDIVADMPPEDAQAVASAARRGSTSYPEEFRKYGHLRLSVGLEDPADLIADYQGIP